MYLMGRIFEYNTGSEEAAREWFFKAIKHGDVLSYNSLYFLEEKHEVANEYLRKGCELNDFMCLWNTGRSFGFGFPGFEADIPKGIEILRKLPKEFGFARADIGKLTAKLHGLSSDEPHEQFQSWFQ